MSKNIEEYNQGYKDGLDFVQQSYVTLGYAIHCAKYPGFPSDSFREGYIDALEERFNGIRKNHLTSLKKLDNTKN